MIPLAQAGPTRSPIPGPCAHCGGSSATPFAAGGLCLRCAGLRVLELETGEPVGPGADNPAGPAGGPGGERIGPYEIIEEIGRGGMGRVYAARQAGMGRIVALKTIADGGRPDLEMRFLREIQTAARLRHPGIVAVHDCGRADGYLYFSMDYIEGGDLAARMWARPYGPRDAARLIRTVALALAYAHGQGILHRDLKPSNILLEGEEPHLADFGLATGLEAGTGLTAATAQLGTPHYLAPEAIRGGSAALTVAGDIYALGVILFELLTGRTPFAGASPAELPALACTLDPPSPRLLAPAVPRDLATVCLACLARDPARRYADATALAGDLGRFLDGEPIRARSPGAAERFGRFARRHRVAFAAGSLVFLTLAVTACVSAWLAVRARSAERQAATDSATSGAVVDFLRNDLLAQAAPDNQPDRDLKLRTVVDRAAAQVGVRFGANPRVELALREALGATYESLGDFRAELVQLGRAAGLRRFLDGPQDPETLADLGLYARVLSSIGRLDEADRLQRQVDLTMMRVFGPEDPRTLHALLDRVYVLKENGRFPEAEALSAALVSRTRRIMGEDSDEYRSAVSDLSSIFFWERRLPEAERLNVAALASYRRILGPENPLTLTSMTNLSAILWVEDKMAEAEAMNRQLVATDRRILGPEHPETVRAMMGLSTTVRELGKLDEALALNQEAVEIRRRILGPDSPDTLASQLNLCLALMEKGRLAEADALATTSLDTARRTLGPVHYVTVAALGDLAEIRRRRGLLESAESLRAEQYAYRRTHGSPYNVQFASAADALGQVRLERGEAASAEAVLRTAQPAWQRLGPDGWRALVSRNLLGAALAAQGRMAEARPLLISSCDGLRRCADRIPPLERRVVAEAQARSARALSAGPLSSAGTRSAAKQPAGS